MASVLLSPRLFVYIVVGGAFLEKFELSFLIGAMASLFMLFQRFEHSPCERHKHPQYYTIRLQFESAPMKFSQLENNTKTQAQTSLKRIDLEGLVEVNE